MQHLQVTPAELRTVARGITAVADEAHHHNRELSGRQDNLNGAAPGFESVRAHADLEIGWQQALATINAKLAVDADLLAINADAYAATEAHNVRLLPGG